MIEHLIRKTEFLADIDNGAYIRRRERLLSVNFRKIENIYAAFGTFVRCLESLDL